jgi:hypothetical protein
MATAFDSSSVVSYFPICVGKLRPIRRIADGQTSGGCGIIRSVRNWLALVVRCLRPIPPPIGRRIS